MKKSIFKLLTLASSMFLVACSSGGEAGSEEGSSEIISSEESRSDDSSESGDSSDPGDSSVDPEQDYFILKGVVRTTENTGIANTQIAYNGFTYKADESGNYQITFDKDAKDGLIYFEKEGYVCHTIKLMDYFKQGEKVYNPTLVESRNAYRSTIYGVVSNLANIVNNDVVVCVNGKKTLTNNAGQYSLSDVPVTSNTIYISYINSKFEYKYVEVDIGNYKTNRNIHVDDVVLNEYVAYRQFYNRNSHVITGRFFKNENDILLDLVSSYDIRSTRFELFFEYDDCSPNEYQHVSSEHDAYFEFTSTGGVSVRYRLNDDWGEGDVTITNATSNGKYHVYFSIPYAYLKVARNDVFGFNLITHIDGDGVTDTSLNLFDADVEWYNKYTYPRVLTGGKIVQASNSINPFGTLTFDNTSSKTHTDVLGTIGTINEHGYQLKVARDENGIYLLTHSLEGNKFSFYNNYEPHFFIDTNPTNWNRDTDSAIKHYSLLAGRWMFSYRVDNAGSVFNDQKNYNDASLYGSGVRFYANQGDMTLYLPYTVLGIEADVTFGLTANVDLGGGGSNWRAWQEPYITGYTSEPHVEEPKSFVRLDKDLYVVNGEDPIHVTTQVVSNVTSYDLDNAKVLVGKHWYEYYGDERADVIGDDTYQSYIGTPSFGGGYPAGRFYDYGITLNYGGNPYTNGIHSNSGNSGNMTIPVTVPAGSYALKVFTGCWNAQNITSLSDGYSTWTCESFSTSDSGIARICVFNIQSVSQTDFVITINVDTMSNGNCTLPAISIESLA